MSDEKFDQKDASEGSTPETKENLSSKVEKTRVRQKSYVMDLRVHSPASLGYFGIEEIDTAPALVRLAKVKGLDVIAVTDFYKADFVDRVIGAAKNSALTVIPGVDIRCTVSGCNDVILSCLFPENYDSGLIEAFLADFKLPPSAAGSSNHVVELPFEEVLAIVERHGGVALPSRMDKTPYRMAVIPLLVERYGFRAFDLAYSDTTRYFKSKWPKVKFNLFSFSDANALAQVGSRIARVKMQTPGFEGVKVLVSRSATEPTRRL